MGSDTPSAFRRLIELSRGTAQLRKEPFSHHKSGAHSSGRISTDKFANLHVRGEPKPSSQAILDGHNKPEAPDHTSRDTEWHSPQYEGRQQLTDLEAEQREIVERLETLGRQIEKNRAVSRRPAVSHSYVTDLEDKSQEQRDLLRQSEETIRQLQANQWRNDRKAPLTNHDTLEQEVVDACHQLEQVMKEKEELSDALSETQSALQTEKEKTAKLETDVQSNRMGQSASAKQAQQYKARAEEAEEKLKAAEDSHLTLKNSIGELTRREESMARLRAFDMRNFNEKMANVLRDRDNALSRERVCQQEKGSLSHKLNLVRKQSEAQQARIVELNEELEDSEKGAEDRKRLKQELLRERTASDRLRKERNDLLIEVKQLRDSRAGVSITAADKLWPSETAALSSLLEKPNSSRPGESKQINLKSLGMAMSKDTQEPQTPYPAMVISDRDGVDLPTQRVTVSDAGDVLERGRLQTNLNGSTVRPPSMASIVSNDTPRQPAPLSFASRPLVPTIRHTTGGPSLLHLEDTGMTKTQRGATEIYKLTDFDAMSESGTARNVLQSDGRFEELLHPLSPTEKPSQVDPFADLERALGYPHPLANPPSG
ncbi:hypothetical protein IAU60_003987 [Kwoniella sp. DSM 27419]